MPRRGQELPAVVAALLALGCSPRRSDCLDVYDLQVCYACGDAPCVGPAARRARGGPFRCAGDTCEQAAPAMPDDGEWECVDLDGAVVCRGGIAPAGVVVGPADPGWRCGARRGSADRICVDLAPDLPDSAARGWRCSFSHERGERRRCRVDPAAPALAAPCGGGRGCLPGDRCLDGRCLPPRPAPSCWLDTDCGGGACRRGSCV